MRLAFVDLETTGGSPVEDRITEVGIIEVDLDPADLSKPPMPIREWSALVNPDAPIPPFIETLTGITNAMVATAPRFEELAADILARLDGRLFIAHNARFDHGFLKNAFRRLGHPFRPPVLCTVRLSRKLYPGYSRHNLDTLIERHRLDVDARHRALGDARLLWQLWQRFHDALPTDRIVAAIDQLTARPSLPRHLDPDVLDTLPKTAGVYLFHGAPVDDEPADGVARDRDNARTLYIGKAKNLRQRVMAHFTGDHLSVREMEISQQMTRLEWIETGGGTQHDLGALLTEAVLVKERMPAYNRQLRKSDDVCAWRLVVDHRRGRWKLALARPDDLFFAQDRDLYGPFASPRQAGVALRAIADAHGLCPGLLGLDRVPSGKPCFAHQVKRCQGACVGRETVAEHTERLKSALASVALRPWPFIGAIAFREGDRHHVVNGWAYLGMAASLDEARALAVTQRPFDPDVYRLLVGRIDRLDAVAWRGTTVVEAVARTASGAADRSTAPAGPRTIGRNVSASAGDASSGVDAHGGALQEPGSGVAPPPSAPNEAASRDTTARDPEAGDAVASESASGTSASVDLASVDPERCGFVSCGSASRALASRDPAPCDGASMDSASSDAVSKDSGSASSDPASGELASSGPASSDFASATTASIQAASGDPGPGLTPSDDGTSRNATKSPSASRSPGPDDRACDDDGPHRATSGIAAPDGAPPSPGESPRDAGQAGSDDEAADVAAPFSPSPRGRRTSHGLPDHGVRRSG